MKSSGGRHALTNEGDSSCFGYKPYREFYDMDRLRILLSALGVLCLLLLTACDPVPPSFQDDSYSSHYQETRFKVSYSGQATVSVAPDGTVRVYGVTSNSSRPNIKVSGAGIKFEVHNCNTLLADEGTIVSAHYCSEVKARNKSEVSAYEVTTVRTLPDAKLGELIRVQTVDRRSNPVPPAPAPAKAN
jgi:hypothetical protein